MRTITTNACRLIQRSGLLTRVTAGSDCVVGLLDGADVRPYDPIDAPIERLLGEPLAVLTAVGGNSDQGCDLRRRRAHFQDLLAVQHVLQAILQHVGIPGVVFHFKHDAIVGSLTEFDGHLPLRMYERSIGWPTLFPGADDTV